MKVLLDTHVWLWSVLEPNRIRPAIRDLIINSDTEVLLSMVSSWEISIKYALKQFYLPEPPDRFIPPRLIRDRIGSLPIEYAHVFQVASLPHHHRDPFDRLLIAQSMIEKIPIITADREFKRYEAEIFWASA